ncbi:MAG: aldo/keto reductase [Deltaproteobacteria bacterium]
MSNDKTSRRGFFGSVAAGIAGSVALSNLVKDLPVFDSSMAFASTGDIPYRKLGRSGERVSAVGLGGYHMAMPKDVQESIRIVRTAIDGGINFMDNCWDYHDGESEIRMGKALGDGYRKKVFLMTKTDGQVKDAYNKQLDECLRRLQTDMIDLVQFHEVIRTGDPDRIFGPGGAIEAAMAARKAGKIRYIGFTGHKDPDIHLKMLETGFKHGFTFDSVQMPLNVMDAHFRSFAHKVIPVAVQHGVGVLGMKPMAAGIILKSDTATPLECLHYAMNLPTSVVITGCESVKDVQQALEAARTFKPMSKEQVAAILSKTATAAAKGEYEPFKTTNQFDGTAHNPQWLG